jgi:hypothetical protein
MEMSTDSAMFTDAEMDELLNEDVPVDSDAPYGRFANGKPRKSPAGKYTERSAPAPGKKRSAPAKTSKAKGPDYKAMSLGLVQLPASMLFMAGQARGNQPLTADAAALLLHGDALADGIAGLAEQDVRVARLLEKISAVGPYSALITPALAITLQMATNHKRVPVGTMGTVSPDELISQVTGVGPDGESG